MAYRDVIVPCLALGLGFAISAGAADVVTERVEKTTSYSGVVSSIDPASSTIIMRSEKTAAPVTYSFNKETVFVDPQGNVISQQVLANEPVTIHYVKDGDRTIVTRVVTSRPGTVIKKETTTTTTETK
jgi:hypothetical protein